MHISKLRKRRHGEVKEPAGHTVVSGGWDLHGCGVALEWEAERKNGQIRGSLKRRHQE